MVAAQKSMLRFSVLLYETVTGATWISTMSHPFILRIIGAITTCFVFSQNKINSGVLVKIEVHKIFVSDSEYTSIRFGVIK